MSDLVLTLEIAGATLLLGIAVLGFFIGRRVYLTRGLGTFDCALRRASADGGGRWAFGIGRYEQNRLDWFRTFAVRPFPTRRFSRTRLIIIERRAPTEADRHIATKGSVIVRCRYGSATIELAMTELAYSGFATWLESAPPGLQQGAYS